jgi:two-component system, chemotaxis family, CheB/CheR fusion protein
MSRLNKEPAVKASGKSTPKPGLDHFLIAIGASAGGLEAIHALFDHFPSNSSFSFVIVQHLSPDHKSLMAQLLSKHTQMQVLEAEDHMFTRPNCVYVLPAGKQLSLKGGRLHLADKGPGREPNFAIDLFLESLAREWGPAGIGVILSGTGTDGTKGSRALKAAGGMVVVQDPQTARFDGMPRSVIEAGVVDFILPPELMPGEIIHYTRQVPLLQAFTGGVTEEKNGGMLRQILDLVCSQTRQDFTHYKETTLNRRLNKRMEQVGVSTPADYLSFLQANPTEINQLGKEFLIGVTTFFRDPEAFELLQETIIPRLIRDKDPEETIKVWVAACSTGEEAYSLAMLFQECCSHLPQELPIKIFATDIDQRALDKASRGSYPAAIARDLSEERLQRFFTRKGNRYTIHPTIRRMVVFARHDLQKDPPFSRLDLISCRNVLIYLHASLQHKVLSLFAFALNVNGYLLLGPSEHIGEMKPFFAAENPKWKLYRKVREGQKTPAPYGMRHHPAFLPPPASQEVKTTQLSRFNDSFMDAVAEDFKVTGLFIDAHYQVLHGIGDINRFLKYPDKRLTANLLKIVPRELAAVLGVDIPKVLRHNQPAAPRQVLVKLGQYHQLVQVTVKAISPEKNRAAVALVLLQEVGQTQLPVPTPESLLPPAELYHQFAALELELKDAHESLQLAIEDLGTANEELQSTNEELMSSNEELQSSNEEMQSLNEELHTVNAEHQLRIRELQELNEDLDNCIRSSNIAQLFLDRHLMIRKFTPMVREIINIIDSDLGRPIHHLSHNLHFPHLLERIRQVNDTSGEVELEVEAQNGRYYLMRILPYLRQGGAKDGVVVSFVDVTTLKTLSNVVQGVLNSSPNHIMAWQAIRGQDQLITDFQWILVNKKAEELLATSQAQLINTSVLAVMPFLRTSGLFKKFGEVVRTGKPLHLEQYLEIRGEKNWYEIAAVKMGDGLTCTLAEITGKKKNEEKILMAYEELKKAEQGLIQLNSQLEERVAARTRELTASEERFRLVSMATNDVVWDWDLVKNEIWWSDTLEGMLGYPASQLAKGLNGWFHQVYPEDQERIRKGIHQAINQGQDQWSDEYRMVKADGTLAFVFNRAYILHNEYNIPYRVLGSFVDLTALKQAQAKLEDTNAHLLRVVQDLDTFVYTASHDLKSPVANVEGLVLLLEQELNEQDRLPAGHIQPIFEMIKDSLNGFKAVIEDLTDVARIQKDIPEEAEPVDLAEVLEQVKGNIPDLVAGEPVSFAIDFQVRTIHFSRRNLYSILYNLVSNAVKYRSPDRPPHIVLSTAWLNNQVVLTVTDNGLGLSPEYLPKLFTLFKRFHSHVEGTGMGLYIVKRMMDNAGGKIEVQSQEGRGTTFRLYFEVPVK